MDSNTVVREVKGDIFSECENNIGMDSLHAGVSLHNITNMSS